MRGLRGEYGDRIAVELVDGRVGNITEIQKAFRVPRWSFGEGETVLNLFDFTNRGNLILRIGL